MKTEIITKSSKETESLAQKIGSELKGGECIEFISDLGGGKTTFVNGLAKGAGSTDIVSSPTFTISQVYVSEKFKINHYDFYRLNEPGLIAEELSETIKDTNNVVVVEWAESVEFVLPKLRLKIEIIKDATERNIRNIEFSYPDELSYLMKEIV